MEPEAVANGLLEFKKEFKGKIFLEILIIEGVNDSDENLGRLTDFCKRLTPDRVDVVTTTRPGTVRGTHPVDGEVLSRWRMGLEQGKDISCPSACADLEDMSMERLTALTLASLARRPQTVPQLAGALNVDRQAVHRAVEALVKESDVIPREDRGETFYHGTAHVIED